MKNLELVSKIRIQDLDLSVRAYNALKSVRCNCVGDVLPLFFKDGVALSIKEVKMLCKKRPELDYTQLSDDLDSLVAKLINLKSIGAKKVYPEMVAIKEVFTEMTSRFQPPYVYPMGELTIKEIQDEMSLIINES